MTEDEGEGEETVVLSRRDRRRAGVVSDAVDEQPLADVDEATIVVDRAKTAPHAAPASSVDEPDESHASDELDERDALVESDASDVPEARDDLVEPDASALAEAEESDAPDEATVVVDRSAAPKPDAPDEATVVVSRPARGLRRKRVDAAGTDESDRPEATAPARVESFAAPTDGPTPAIYKPRPAPLAPVAPPVVVGAAAPTRVEDPGLPSVAKQGQRWSLLTLVATAGACVVSVAGLVALGFVVFG